MRARHDGRMRAATRKRTEAHKAEMAARAERRSARRRRRVALLVSQAQAREFSRKRLEQIAELEQRYPPHSED